VKRGGGNFEHDLHVRFDHFVAGQAVTDPHFREPLRHHVHRDDVRVLPVYEGGMDIHHIGHLFSPKEVFDKFPGRELWAGRLKEGDAVVIRERMEDGKILSRSFPMCLGGPLDAPYVLDGLLKPIKGPQLLARPGDVLVLWHAGGKQQAIADC